MISSLSLAVLLGAVIGIERERIHRAAGLKTHVLVSLGAALFAYLSRHGFFIAPGTTDPSRVAAQIVSGIGFLGAGTIMKQGATIRGLTTAASLWVVAGIGMACGTGIYQAAVTATILFSISMFIFKAVERPIRASEYSRIVMRIPNQPGLIDAIRDLLHQHGVSFKNMEMDVEEKTLILRMILQVPSSLDRATLLGKLHESGVQHVEW